MFSTCWGHFLTENLEKRNKSTGENQKHLDAAFLLTVRSFLLTAELFYLQLTSFAFYLQLELFCLQF